MNFTFWLFGLACLIFGILIGFEFAMFKWYYNNYLVVKRINDKWEKAFKDHVERTRLQYEELVAYHRSEIEKVVNRYFVERLNRK